MLSTIIITIITVYLYNKAHKLWTEKPNPKDFDITKYIRER